MRLLSLLALLALVTSMGCPACGNLNIASDVTVDYNLAYIDDGDGQHTLDLYVPNGTEAATPVVLFFHGGYWTSQDKQFFEGATGLYGNVGAALSREGYIVANGNYRLGPTNSLDDMLNDVDAAADFIRQRFPEAPVYLSGHSAGAHLAASAALLTGGPQTPVDGLILLSGLYDIETAFEMEEKDVVDSSIVPVFGVTAEARAAGTVIDELISTGAPALFVTGQADLPAALADIAVLKGGRDPALSTFVDVDGAEHADIVFQIGAEADAVTPAVVDFLRR
jgi:acetyl esterase/lipase